jgi:hypothetical protein
MALSIQTTDRTVKRCSGRRPRRGALRGPWLACLGLFAASLALLSAVATPARLSAQAVRGRMLEAGTGVPVPGALIELRNDQDSIVDRTLTDDGGRYSLQASAAGRYRLHAERIGFRDWDSDPLELAAARAVTRDIQVSTQPVSVSSLSVQADRKCRLEPQLGVATYLMWEEVRKALRLTLLSRGGEPYRYVRERYTRELDENGRKVRSEETHVDTTVKATPYPILSADRLARDGFVSGEMATGRTYYVPGVETLLAEPFLETHCIQAEGDRKVAGERWIGLGFRPKEGRSLPDVEGTLWLAASGSELREMEFHYVNVDVPLAPRHRKDEGIPGGMMPSLRQASTEKLGGQLIFRRLPTGRWIIRDWRVTLPVTGATNAWWDPTKRYAYVLTGRHEEGGEVLHVTDQSGRNLFNHERASLAGFVADSTRGAPLAGAIVRVEGTPYRDTTDADGAFQIPDLPEGKFKVSFTHPRLDSLGVSAPEATVQLAEGSMTRVELAIPSPKAQLASGCPAPSGDAANLVGILRDEATRVPLPFASLTLHRGTSPGSGSAGAAGQLAQGQTDATGAFRMCGVPAGSGLGLSVTFPGRPSATLRLDLAAGGTVDRDVAVPSAAPAGVAGRVISADDGSPLAGASIALSDAGAFTTGNDGRFRFEKVSEGLHEVRIELQGYGPALDTVELASGESLELEVRLATKVVAVQPIQVVVMRAAPEQGLSRRSRRLYELDRVAIDSVLQRVPDMAGLLQQMQRKVPGLLVEEVDVPVDAGPNPLRATANPGGAARGMLHGLCISTTHATGQLQPSAMGNRGCAMVQVYVDDVLIPSQEAGSYVQSMDPSRIERMQFVPAVDAGARYGTGAQNGVLLIYTRAGRPASDSSGGG